MKGTIDLKNHKFLNHNSLNQRFVSVRSLTLQSKIRHRIPEKH